CLNKKAINYKYYGGKGIKFKLTMPDVMDLWIRDNAEDMKKPSLDRVNSDKDYSFDNCRFMEHTENCGRANRGRVREHVKKLARILAKDDKALKELADNYLKGGKK
ncbi:unnamed protein product, partial [marine sediment metagenome]